MSAAIIWHKAIKCNNYPKDTVPPSLLFVSIPWLKASLRVEHQRRLRPGRLQSFMEILDLDVTDNAVKTRRYTSSAKIGIKY
jgi:hypothetical protein